MRHQRLPSAVAAVLAVAVAAPTYGQSVEEEVRRVVNNSISRTVSDVLEETLTRADLAGAQMPTTTLFVSPLYNHSSGDFGDGEFDADTYGGLGGMLHKTYDRVFVHASVAAANAEIDGSEDITAWAGLAGVNYILENTRERKAWVSLEGTLATTESDDEDLEGSAWVIKPSLTGSFRLEGEWIAEPSVGVAFADVFDVDDTEVSKTLDVGLRLKYRQEQWRPQFNAAYFKTLDPDTDDDGFFAVGPELNYVWAPGRQVGVAYSYSAPIDADFDFDSHTVIGSIRWTF